MKRFILNNKVFIHLSFCLALIIFGCSKNVPLSPKLTPGEQGSVLGKAGGATQISDVSSGATQISGVGLFDGTDECNSAGQGAAYALTLTGDLEGCHYFFVDEFECSPSGTYREVGRELFVGTYNGQSGTFGQLTNLSRSTRVAPQTAPI